MWVLEDTMFVSTMIHLAQCFWHGALRIYLISKNKKWNIFHPNTINSKVWQDAFIFSFYLISSTEHFWCNGLSLKSFCSRQTPEFNCVRISGMSTTKTGPTHSGWLKPMIQRVCLQFWSAKPNSALNRRTSRSLKPSCSEPRSLNWLLNSTR